MSEEIKPKIAKCGSYAMDMEPGEYWWCTCGESEKQPFCDGKHKEKKCFSPKKVVITQAQRVAWCGCKYSEKGHLCDGTHKKFR